MKYCKKCFRNVREDVDKCPYCGAGGLEDYGSGNSGEAFTCSQPHEVEREIQQEIESLNPSHSKADDAYSTEEFSPFDMFNDEEKAEDAYAAPEDDVYGSRRHTDDNCGNAPTPAPASASASHSFGSLTAVPDPSDPKYKMRVEYLKMLKKIDGISKERIDELMRKYDEIHGNDVSRTNVRVRTNANTNTNTSANAESQGGARPFIRTADSSTGSANNPTSATQPDVFVMVSLVIYIFIGFQLPPIGIILINSLRGKVKTMSADKQANVIKVINIFTVILIIICIAELGGILTGIGKFIYG
jgi:hypothetical protein